jgi:hypothetical protein
MAGWCLGTHKVTGARIVAWRAPVSCLIDTSCKTVASELPLWGWRVSLAALHDYLTLSTVALPALPAFLIRSIAVFIRPRGPLISF